MMREFKIFDLTMSIAALIIAALLIYLAIFMMGWIIGIEKMESLEEFMSASSGVMISLLIIAGSAFALAFLVMFVCWLCKDEGGIIILPFEVAAGEDKYSGKALSDLLTAELLRISRIHDPEVEYKGITPIEVERLNMPELAPTSESFAYTVSQLGPVGLGTTSIHIGPLIAILKKLWPRRDNGQVISGSLQKYGSIMSIIASLEHKEINAWEVSCEIDVYCRKSDEKIHEITKDLAFKVIYDLKQDEISAKTWQGFKHFTEALDAYRQYNLTGAKDKLDRARSECISAANSERSYEKLIKLLYNLGMAYTDKKELSKAEELLFLAYEIKPDNESALFGLGYLYGIQDRFQKAIDCFERVTTTKPESSPAWYNKGTALGKLGRMEEAFKAFEKAIEIDPQKEKAWYNKGLSLHHLGRMEEAIEAYDKAIEINPQKEEAWYNKGLSLSHLGRMEEAIEAYEKAIEINPQKEEAWHNKGFALSNIGRTEEAIEAYEKAIEIEPKDAARHIVLARLYRRLGREAKSAEACKNARDLIEKESEYNRACFEAVCGSPDAALGLLRTALENKEQTADWARWDPDFEFIRDDPRFKALLDEFSASEDKGPE